jgi:hypothetical protein
MFVSCCLGFSRNLTMRFFNSNGKGTSIYIRLRSAPPKQVLRSDSGEFGDPGQADVARRVVDPAPGDHLSLARSPTVTCRRPGTAGVGRKSPI